MDTVKVDNLNIKMIGHAGLAGLVMVNTEEGFRYAGERSYYGIETDIRKTKDGHFVCFHDPNLLAAAGVDVTIEGSTLEELSEIILFDKRAGDTKNEGHKIITLGEYLDICKKYGKVAVIELKTPYSKEDVGSIIEIVRQHSYLENSIFISFYYDNLTYVRDHVPSQEVAFTFKTNGDDIEGKFEKITSDRFDVLMSHQIIEREWVERFHAKGCKITCYTVDDPKRAEELVSWGVDYMITNVLE